MGELDKDQSRARTYVEDTANELLSKGKKLANDLYDESKNKINEAELNVKEYSDELVVKIKEHPVSSVLIAAGVGFLLSMLVKK